MDLKTNQQTILIPSGRISITFPEFRPGDAKWRYLYRCALNNISRCREGHLLVHFIDGDDGTLYDKDIDTFLCSLTPSQYAEYDYPKVEIMENGKVLDFRKLSLLITVKKPTITVGSDSQTYSNDHNGMGIHVVGELSLLVIED